MSTLKGPFPPLLQSEVHLVYHSTSQYIIVYQSISEYIRVYYSISQSISLYHSTLQYINIPQYITVHQDITIYHSISSISMYHSTLLYILPCCSARCSVSQVYHEMQCITAYHEMQCISDQLHMKLGQLHSTAAHFKISSSKQSKIAFKGKGGMVLVFSLYHPSTTACMSCPELMILLQFRGTGLGLIFCTWKKMG